MTRGADLYATGAYIEAEEVFEHTEARLAEYSAEERARYGLYRGASLLTLGDVPRASHWLAYARARSGELSEEERRMLQRALGVAAARQTESERLAGTPSLAPEKADSAAKTASY